MNIGSPDDVRAGPALPPASGVDGWGTGEVPMDSRFPHSTVGILDNHQNKIFKEQNKPLSKRK